MKKLTLLIIAALLSLTSVAQNMDTMDSLIRMGFEYSKQKEYAKSDDCFRQVSAMYSIMGWDTLAFKANEMIVKNRVDSLRNAALSYSKVGDYIRSNECYEMALLELQAIVDSETLGAKINNGIAINHIRMGHASLKKNKYEDARHHYLTAVEHAIPDSEAHKMALRGVGNTYSRQVTDLKFHHFLSNDNLEIAIDYCLNAEHYYDLASATENRLKEQVTRAGILNDLNRTDEAIALYRQIVNECEGESAFNGIRGTALYKLGVIYKDKEQFKDAIEYLEQGYELCIMVDDKQTAYWAAKNLATIYDSQIPDMGKLALWNRRADKLESEIPTMKEVIQQIKDNRQNGK